MRHIHAAVLRRVDMFITPLRYEPSLFEAGRPMRKWLKTDLSMIPEEERQMNEIDDDARECLKIFQNGILCKWCKHTEKQIYRKGFCRHCYEIARELENAEKKLRQYQESRNEAPFLVNVAFRTAKGMAEAARIEGGRYGDPLNRHVSGLDLEHEFWFLSSRFRRKRFSAHHANFLAQSFTEHQRRLLFHLIGLMNRENDRKNRRHRAYVAALKNAG